MGNVNIKQLGGFNVHENTLNEYSHEISEELFDHHLQQITSIYKNCENCVCYVFGMGAQPKSTYTELREENGINVVWSKSILSGVYKMLSILIASYAGLVKISEPDKLPNVFKKLSHLSMVGVYIFDQSLEKEFVNSVIKNPLSKEFSFGIKSDNGYFFYIVDADSMESSTGIYEIVSYGKSASSFANIF